MSEGLNNFLQLGDLLQLWVDDNFLLELPELTIKLHFSADGGVNPPRESKASHKNMSQDGA